MDTDTAAKSLPPGISAQAKWCARWSCFFCDLRNNEWGPRERCLCVAIGQHGQPLAFAHDGTQDGAYRKVLAQLEGRKAA